MKLNDYLDGFSKEFKYVNLKYFIDHIIKAYRKFPDEYECYVQRLTGPNKMYAFRVGFVQGVFTMHDLWYEVELENIINQETLVLKSNTYKYLNSIKDIEEINSILFNIFD